jgi:hypothetical protein
MLAAGLPSAPTTVPLIVRLAAYCVTCGGAAATGDAYQRAPTPNVRQALATQVEVTRESWGKWSIIRDSSYRETCNATHSTGRRQSREGRTSSARTISHFQTANVRTPFFVASNGRPADMY